MAGTPVPNLVEQLVSFSDLSSERLSDMFSVAIRRDYGVHADDLLATLREAVRRKRIEEIINELKETQ